MRRNIIILVIVIIITFIACFFCYYWFNKNEVLLVSFSEDPVGYKEGRHVFLHLATQDTYHSLGYGIKTEMKAEGNIIEINLFTEYDNLIVIQPEVMTSKSPGPARTSLDLGKIKGDYRINIIYKDFIDKYQLSIEDEEIEVVSLKNRFSDLVEVKNLSGVTDSNQILKNYTINRK